jgi:hypothetical protein
MAVEFSLQELKELYLSDEFIKIYDDAFSGFPGSPKYPEILEIDGFPVHFDPNAEMINVSFSGGADSSMLTVLLAKLIQKYKLKTKITPVYMARFTYSKPWLEPMALDVYNYIKNMFPDIIQDIQTGFIPEIFETTDFTFKYEKQYEDFPKEAGLDAIYAGSFGVYMVKKLGASRTYSGTTMNPPPINEDAEIIPFREEEVIMSTNHWVIGPFHINPLGYLRKDFTMAMYEKYDLYDLLKLTRSCEVNLVGLGEDYKYVDGVYPPECGHCFFCLEKKWGIENMGKFL